LIPLRILYIAVHEGNAGWGAETFLASALEALGHTVIRVDYRAHRHELPAVLDQVVLYDPHIVLLQRGERFPLHLLTAVAPVKVYYATEGASDQDQRQVLQSGAFDAYVAASRTTLSYMVEECRISTASAFHIPSAFDPGVYRAETFPVEYDVAAVWNWTKRRKQAFGSLGWRVHRKAAHSGLYGAACNDVFNRSRIVLNIHRSETLDTETRLFELLPTNAAIVSEECDAPELFEDAGIHWFRRGDWKEMRRLVQLLLREDGARVDSVRRNNALAPHHTWMARAASFTRLFEELYTQWRQAS